MCVVLSLGSGPSASTRKAMCGAVAPLRSGAQPRVQGVFEKHNILSAGRGADDAFLDLMPCAVPLVQAWAHVPSLFHTLLHL